MLKSFLNTGLFSEWSVGASGQKTLASFEMWPLNRLAFSHRQVQVHPRAKWRRRQVSHGGPSTSPSSSPESPTFYMLVREVNHKSLLMCL